MDLVLLAFAFVVILAGAELFTNGIEWFGHKLNVAEGAVGSVLAAVGTALPETMIPLIAILLGSGEGANEIGIGAILGLPSEHWAVLGVLTNCAWTAWASIWRAAGSSGAARRSCRSPRARPSSKVRRNSKFPIFSFCFAAIRR